MFECFNSPGLLPLTGVRFQLLRASVARIPHWREVGEYISQISFQLQGSVTFWFQSRPPPNIPEIPCSAVKSVHVQTSHTKSVTGSGQYCYITIMTHLYPKRKSIVSHPFGIFHTTLKMFYLIYVNLKSKQSSSLTPCNYQSVLFV